VTRQPAEREWEKAVEVVYRECWMWLVERVARRIVGPDAAEDVVQAVFIDLLRRGPSERALDRGRIAAAVRNRALGLLRRRRRRRRRAARWLRDLRLPKDVPEDPAGLTRRRHIRRLVRQGVAALPSQQREVFTRYYLEGQTVREIAHALGIAPSTVKNHRAAARKALRKHLEAHGVEGPDVV